MFVIRVDGVLDALAEVLFVINVHFIFTIRFTL